jgi:hypothetical protein
MIKPLKKVMAMSKSLLKRESIDSYRPDDELKCLAADAGFVMPDFAVEYGNDWGGRKVTLMWISLAKFRHLVQQEEKVKFADAYVEFKSSKK